MFYSFNTPFIIPPSDFICLYSMNLVFKFAKGENSDLKL